MAVEVEKDNLLIVLLLSKKEVLEIGARSECMSMGEKKGSGAYEAPSSPFAAAG